MSNVAEILKAVKQLTPTEQIDLVEQVWDSVTADAPDSIELSPEQVTELDRRLDRIERDGVQGVEWEQFRRELSGGQ